tara:strand:+ start:713 stop:1015 length:303 start_codon:yes stop_codon:yes gene_type:complete
MDAHTVHKREDADFSKKVAAIAKRFKGKGGGPDAESCINANKHDINQGFVYFWSDNSDVANLLNRSMKYVLEVSDYGETVQIKMDKTGFRSCVHSFKVAN